MLDLMLKGKGAFRIDRLVQKLLGVPAHVVHSTVKNHAEFLFKRAASVIVR